MKIKIDVDMTPIEARELMGLPDVRPMQEAWLKKMNEQMEDHLDNLTPEAMIQNWMKAAGGNAEIMSDFMSAFMSLSTKN